MKFKQPTKKELQKALEEVSERIAEYEGEFGAPAAEMRRKVVANEWQESGKMCHLLMLMNRRTRLLAKISLRS